MPHPSDNQTLLDMLHEEYKAYVAGLGPVNMLDPLASFLGFAEKYLDQHRTVETFPIDANCGIRLSNNKRCVIHPPTNAGDGSMQESGAVGVTEGKSQVGQEGVTEAGDTKVI